MSEFHFNSKVPFNVSSAVEVKIASKTFEGNERANKSKESLLKHTRAEISLMCMENQGCHALDPF